MVRRHRLSAGLRTVHLGGLSSRLDAALEIASGDIVEVQTLTGVEVAPDAPPGFASPALLEIRRDLPAERRPGPGPHLLTGPITVTGAEPGDVLEVELLRITSTGAFGFNAIRQGWGVLPERFSTPRLRFLPLDLETMTVELSTGSGVRVPIEPFFGVLAVSPAGEAVSSIPPGRFGGNLDCRELREGSRVYLPVQVAGAMFSIGDGHAAQGDGEVDCTAVEAALDGEVRLTVRKDLKETWPFAVTSTHLISFGLAASLDEALTGAVERLVNLARDHAGVGEEEAYVLCSIAASFRITQAVNTPMRGVHGMLPLSVLPRTLSIGGRS